MDGKRILLLSALLLGLLAIAWLTGIFGGEVSTVKVPDLQLPEGELESVDLRKEGVELTIRRQGESWMLTQPVQARADTSRMSDLVRDIRGVVAETVVSTSPERHALYQVDEENATVVELGYGVETRLLYIGKPGPDMQSRYVRLGGDDSVIEATRVPNIVVTQDHWRDKGLWVVAPFEVVSVDVQRPDETYSLKIDGPGWSLDTGNGQQPADSSGVARLMDRISVLTADGFHPELKADSVRSVADHRLQVVFRDGTRRRIDMLKRDSDLAATMDDGGDVYKLFSYRLAQLAPPVADLVK